ncbi:MAG: NTP transferase domain-containing protein [Deltaproteobacteria bacterium]|nr:NTP transferase domain-containing protein [Deltaproteobacteria bacterium]
MNHKPGKGKMLAVVQARMSSKRLPGKALHPIQGKPMLLYLIERVRRCPSLDDLIVATSTEESDDVLAAFCAQWEIPCYRGSLADVSSRFKEILDERAPYGCLRVNGDSPLLDGTLIERAIGIFLGGEWDLVTNVQVRSYPKGQSVEVIRTETYQKAYAKMATEEEREHVTRYFYIHPQPYKIHNIHSGRNYGMIQLSVDTPEDMTLIEGILARMTRPHWEYGLEDVLRLREEVLAGC